MRYELTIKYKFPTDEVLEIIGETVAQSAKERIADQDGIEPLGKYIPAQLKWQPKKIKQRKANKGNKIGVGRNITTAKRNELQQKEEIYQKMIKERGIGAKALWHTGALMSSFRFSKASADEVVITNRMDYAMLHQFGGTSTVENSKLDDWEDKFGVIFDRPAETEVQAREPVRFEDKERELTINSILALLKGGK